MSILNVARKFVQGDYEELAGLGINDAVHVLATRYQLHKADLRSAIQTLYGEESPAIHGEPVEEVEEYVPSYNAAAEGGEA